jgi:5'-deoxynucleotidase
MKNITRWGLMRNTRQENLSEHTLETAYIAHALAIINNCRLSGDIDPCKTAVCAMFHDTSEIITGDLPTPIKYYNPEIKNVYKQIEKTAEERLVSLLPEDMQSEFNSLYSPNPAISRLVKAADKISALIKCTEELAVSNREFTAAHRSTLKAIHELNCPEAEIFLDEFMESFSLTLDEQNGAENND